MPKDNPQPSFRGMGKYAPRKSTVPGYQRHNREEVEQRDLFTFRDTFKERHWALQKLVAVPNGAFVPPGERGKLVGTGMTEGVWDVVLPHAKTEWHEENGEKYCIFRPGMWIEMKVGKNTLSSPQEDWRDLMQDDGWYCIVCYSWRAAARAVVEWIGIKDAQVEAYIHDPYSRGNLK